MFILGNFIEALARIIDMALDIYMWLIIIRAIISWVNPDPYNPIVNFLYRVTEPVLFYVRRWLPLRRMGIDISPIIVLIIIMFLQSFLVKSMLQFSLYLK